MNVINASAVEKALIGKLAADATLAGLLPDGVFYDVAPINSTKFTLVSISTSRGAPELQDGDSFRAFVYLVKAVVLGSSKDPITAADKRIHELLDHGSLDLPDAGGSLMALRWVDRVRYTEMIAAETWQHRGGRFEVIVTPD